MSGNNIIIRLGKNTLARNSVNKLLSNYLGGIVDPDPDEAYWEVDGIKIPHIEGYELGPYGGLYWMVDNESYDEENNIHHWWIGGFENIEDEEWTYLFDISRIGGGSGIWTVDAVYEGTEPTLVRQFRTGWADVQYYRFLTTWKVDYMLSTEQLYPIPGYPSPDGAGDGPNLYKTPGAKEIANVYHKVKKSFLDGLGSSGRTQESPSFMIAHHYQEPDTEDFSLYLVLFLSGLSFGASFFASTAYSGTDKLYFISNEGGFTINYFYDDSETLGLNARRYRVAKSITSCTNEIITISEDTR